jgi:ABC-2 type transport system permease protein
MSGRSSAQTGPPGLSASFRICLQMMRARAVADMQYRLSFALRLVAVAVALLGDVFAIWAIEHRFGSIGGWSLGPLLFLLGVVLVSFRIADAFVGGAIERCAELVRTGRLDSMMIRPVGVLWQILGDAFAVRRVIQLLTVSHRRTSTGHPFESSPSR